MTALAPAHGPPAGGTSIELRLDPPSGGGAPSNVSCRFGEFDGRGAVVGEGVRAALAALELAAAAEGEPPHVSVNCTAPSAEAAGAAWALDASFTAEQVALTLTPSHNPLTLTLTQAQTL